METRTKALAWWKNTLSINEQNALIKKHFPNWGIYLVENSSSKIQEIYEKEYPAPVKPEKTYSTHAEARLHSPLGGFARLCVAGDWFTSSEIRGQCANCLTWLDDDGKYHVAPRR